MPRRRCSGESTRNSPPNDQNAWPPRFAAGSWSSRITRLPASASSAVADQPGEPGPDHDDVRVHGSPPWHGRRPRARGPPPRTIAREG